MRIKCSELSHDDQVLMMNKIREWKATEEASRMQGPATPSYELLGRGMTPRTYSDAMKLKAKWLDPQSKSHDYLIKTTSGEMAGVIGYTRNYLNDETQVLCHGLYVIQFGSVGGYAIVKALDEVYDEMLQTSDEVTVTAVLRDKNPDKDPFKKGVMDKYRVLLVENLTHIDANYEEHPATRIILKGYLKEKGRQ